MKEAEPREENLESKEDQWLLDQVEETIKDIKSGKEKLHSWESVKRKLSE